MLGPLLTRASALARTAIGADLRQELFAGPSGASGAPALALSVEGRVEEQLQEGD